MKANGAGSVSRRRSSAEGARLVVEFERSGLERKEFCAERGLKVHTLDAWRRRMVQPASREKIVPVEIVEERAKSLGAMPAAAGRVGHSGQLRVVLADGLRTEMETGFNAEELRRLIVAVNGVGWAAAGCAVACRGRCSACSVWAQPRTFS